MTIMATMPALICGIFNFYINITHFIKLYTNILNFVIFHIFGVLGF